jgi:hypothetical protein
VVARTADLAVVYLVAPTTEPGRRALIAARTGGFLYCVSLVGVTGARATLPKTVGRLVRDVRAVSPVPVAVGFGVSRPGHVRALVGAGADGVIVASALVDALGPDGRDVEALGRLVAELRVATRRRRYPRAMAPKRLATAEEVGPKKTFRWAVDWPGWARGGKDSELARDALIASAPRYAVVAAQAGLDFPDRVAPDDLDLVESVPGGSGTDFGVPSATTPADRRPADTDEATRLAALVEAAWVVFDRVAAAAPAELRKGPRGGGRNTAKIVGHVIEADHAYAREIGVRLRPPSPGDRAAVEAERAAMLEVIRQPSDGSPLADRRWTARYAARRIAWHALDHAWEIEDRTDPG